MLSESERHKIDQHLQQWIQQMTEEIPNLIHQIQTDTKSSRYDLVTNVDQTIESRFEQFLKTYYPHHRLYGEEAHHET